MEKLIKKWREMEGKGVSIKLKLDTPKKTKKLALQRPSTDQII
jgi:phage regulator Rha-like protein